MAGYRIVLQDNLWFRGAPSFNNYVLFGESMIPVDPLLGRTASSDRLAKRQELQWLLRYTGRSGNGLVVSQEWIQPGDLIDDNLRDTFLPLFERDGGRGRWNIFYDPVLAAFQRQLITGPPLDFSLPEIRDMWESDLDYLEEGYFEHPMYWRIDGKPVLYVWAVHSALRNADAAFAAALARGHYLLGDTLSARVREPGFVDSLPPLSGVTGFVIVVPELGGTERRIDEVTPELGRLYEEWRQATAERSLDFMPAGSFQYDDTEFQRLRGGTPTRILARNVDDLAGLLRTARDAALPAGDARYLFWGTINNWAEGTTVLPTEPPPPATSAFYVERCSNGLCARRIGHYGFSHLETVRKVLFPRVPAYRGPVVKASRPQRVGGGADGETLAIRVRFRECDVAGRLRLNAGRGVEVLNPPDLESFANLTRRPRFRFRWSARVRVKPGAEPRTVKLRLRFRNLDGRSARMVLLDRGGTA